MAPPSIKPDIQACLFAAAKEFPARPLTKWDIAVELGINHRTAQRKLDELRAEGKAYIRKWERIYRTWIPAYQHWRCHEQPKPAPQTRAEKAAKVRKLRKDLPEVLVREDIMRKAAKAKAEKVKKLAEGKPLSDDLTAMLYKAAKGRL
jgi:predicted ArsR family transcriptional regulator